MHFLRAYLPALDVLLRQPYNADVNTKSIEIEDLAYLGSGVGKIDGKACFVPFTAPGDRAEIRIMNEKKKVCFGEIVEILRPSEHRIRPKCPVFGICGGCDWQHLPYDYQISVKRHILETALERIGNLPAGTVPVNVFPAPSPWNYRNAVQVRIDPQDGPGFYQKKSNRIVPVESCPIACSEINRRLEELKHFFDSSAPAAGGPGGEREEVELYIDADGRLHEDRHPAGERAFSFHQINREMNNLILSRLKRWAEETLPPEAAAADVFCGNGNLSLPLAGTVRRIVGWDTSETALQEGRDRTDKSASDCRISFRRGKAENILRKLAADSRGYSLLILDPPRGGLKKSSGVLPDLSIPWIFYLSCDPPGLARDMKQLSAGGYEPVRIEMYDMFPQTYHIECGVYLKNVRSHPRTSSCSA